MAIEAVIANQIIDASTVGRNALTAADAAAFRSTIGAGTSSFDGAYSSLTGNPTTLAGYGITNALALSGGTLTGTTRISTGVNLEFASASHYLMSDASSMFVDSSGDLWVRRSGSANFRVNQTNATASLRGVWTRVVCLTADHTTPIAYLVPGSTDAKLRADGGLRVRNLADSADANFIAAVGTFSSIVTGTITNTGTITLPTSTTTLVGRDTTDTLTNKRLQRRIVSTTSATTLTPDISAADFYEYTALAAGLTINNPTGTPVNGELLNFRLQDNGTGRAITWGAQFRSMTSTLPTTTVANKTHRILCEWNSGDSTWDCLAVSAQP